MNRLPEALYRAEQVRELDRIAIEDFNCPGSVLMERAGQAAFAALRLQRPRCSHLAVLCGVGNNAGDGYVIARLALQAGMQVMVFTLGDPDRLRGDALVMADQYLALQGQRQGFAQQDLGSYPVIVDAMLGTGIRGAVTGEWAEAIETVNRARMGGSFVLAVDIPSGLNADTGHVAGVAVLADLTTTYIGVKQGLLTADGPQHTGTLLFDDLGVDSEVYAGITVDVRRLNDTLVRDALPARAKNTNKANFGKVLIVGGNAPYFGAARLAGEAALRSGAGIVALATRQQHAAMMNPARPELICHGVETREALATLLRQFNTVVIGPGLGTDQWAQDMLAAVLDCDLPAVIDADGLNGLAREPMANERWILTPHPGEAARLLGCTTREIQQDRFEAIRQLQHKYRGCIVLKGCGTLIKTAQHGIDLCNRGNPGMATGGMGDVLAGLLGGLLAQGLELACASRVGVQVHAHAADIAVRENGERGLLASDLLPFMRRLLNAPLVQQHRVAPDQNITRG